MLPRILQSALLLVAVSVPLPAEAGGPVGVPAVLACAPKEVRTAAGLVGDTLWLTVDKGRSWVRAAQFGAEFSAFRSGGRNGDLSGGRSGDGVVQTEIGAAEVDPFVEEIGQFDSDPSAVSSSELPDGIIHLAVSDTGQWALYREPWLIRGGPSGSVIKKKIESAKGFLFDRQGRLWAVLPDAVVVFSERGNLRKRWRTIGAGVPARGGKPGEFLVPATEGILRVVTEETRVDYGFLKVMKVGAVAARPHSNEVFYTRAGFLETSDGFGNRSKVALLPRNAKRILVDSAGALWISPSENSLWYRLEGTTWRTEQTDVLAVDARGDLWRGTKWGPDGRGVAASVESPLQHHGFSRSPRWFGTPPSYGPPPCPGVFSNWLPRASLFFYKQKGIHLDAKMPSSGWERGRMASGYGVVLKLSWEFKNVSTTLCRRETREWFEARQLRWRNAEQAWKRWRRSRKWANTTRGGSPWPTRRWSRLTMRSFFDCTVDVLRDETVKRLLWMSVLLMIVFQNSVVRGESPSGLVPDGGIENERDEPIAPKEVEDIPRSPQSKLALRVEKILRSFANEPTLRQLKQAALVFADADQHTARRWRRVPNLAALLPVFKIVVDHDLERDETLDRRQDEPDIWGVDTDRDWGLQMAAQWQLGELIFHSDEIRIWNALADRAARREAVLAILVGYFYERRRMQLQLLLEPPEMIGEMVELKLRLDELTASIDSLTGGALSAGLGVEKR